MPQSNCRGKPDRAADSAANHPDLNPQLVRGFALFLRTRAMNAEAVTASVRSSGVFLADQGAIWQGVEDMVTGLDADSPTAAMDAVYERRADDIAGYLRHLRCQAGQTGVVAAVGGQAMCPDLFDPPETLAGLWDRLIPSYAGLVGAALAVENTILHLALFRTDERRRESHGVRFASVDERRGRFARG